MTNTIRRMHFSSREGKAMQCNDDVLLGEAEKAPH